MSKKVRDIRSADVDVTVEGTREIQRFIRQMKNNGLGARLIQARGPGGGWPVFRITGTAERLSTWLVEDYGIDDDVFEYMNRVGVE